MPNYIIRNADADLWQKFKERAQKEGHPLRWLILRMIETYVKSGM